MKTPIWSTIRLPLSAHNNFNFLPTIASRRVGTISARDDQTFFLPVTNSLAESWRSRGVVESWSRGVKESWSLGLLGFRDGYLGVHLLDSSLVYKVIQLIINLFLAARGPIPDSSRGVLEKLREL